MKNSFAFLIKMCVQTISHITNIDIGLGLSRFIEAFFLLRPMFEKVLKWWVITNSNTYNQQKFNLYKITWFKQLQIYDNIFGS